MLYVYLANIPGIDNYGNKLLSHYVFNITVKSLKS